MDRERDMTKKNHKCNDCEKILPNQAIVDWDFNTGFMVIQIQPFLVNLRDVMDEKDGDFQKIGPKEREAREKMEGIKKRLLDRYNEGL